MKMVDMINAVQGHLRVQVDGKAGPETWTAIYKSLLGPTPVQADAPDESVDERSRKNIATLLPEVRPLAVALIEKAAAHDIVIEIISGTRSYSEQDEIYAIGRTRELHRKPVSNAKGGYSNHNFGIAFDVGIFIGEHYVGDSPLYETLGVLGEELGLFWGGRWKHFYDGAHFQLRPQWAAALNESQMLAELRKRHQNGTDVYA
ncbi:MAG: M15 family metallopeptidase [Pseudomonas putida]